MVSLEGLTKVVDPSQLTPEFDGCLEYNHEEWIEIRVAFEDYISNATHMLSRLEELQDILAKKELPQDLEGARNMIEEHSQLKKKVIKAPIEDLDLEGQKLLQRIQSSDSFPKKNSGSGNADLQNLLPKVSTMLDRLHSTRQHLHQMWHVRKLKLDQCFQLRLFEQDAEKVNMGRDIPTGCGQVRKEGEESISITTFIQQGPSRNHADMISHFIHCVLHCYFRKSELQLLKV